MIRTPPNTTGNQGLAYTQLPVSNSSAITFQFVMILLQARETEAHHDAFQPVQSETETETGQTTDHGDQQSNFFTLTTVWIRIVNI